MKGDRSFKIKACNGYAYVSVVLVDNPDHKTDMGSHIRGDRWRTWVVVYSDYSYVDNSVYNQHSISINVSDKKSSMNEYYAPMKIKIED